MKDKTKIIIILIIIKYKLCQKQITENHSEKPLQIAFKIIFQSTKSKWQLRVFEISTQNNGWQKFYFQVIIEIIAHFVQVGSAL